ncbi:MAG: type II secretion system F family protein [Firmicutes bacterium]|nr:type II secretion system F family protein [Bacillota bacterium]
MKSSNSGKQLNPLDISVFFRELSLLFESGISMGEALYIMGENTTDAKKKELCEQIGRTVDEGNTLTDAIADTGKFPQHAVRMVDIGQTSGKMEQVLDGLAVYYERQDSLNKSIKNALTFPLIMIAVMFCVLAVLIIKVLPLFGAVFKETGAKMPLILRLVTESSGFSAGLIAALVAILILLVIAFISAGKVLSADGDGKGIIASIPFMRALQRKSQSGNFAYSMALLLSGGVLLDQAVEMTGEMTSSTWIKEKCRKINEDMMMGETFASAVASSGLFEGTYPSLLAAGEKAGRTDSMMNLIADRYTDEINDKINSVLGVIEPTLVIVMSVLVGGILLSIMVPLMNIMTSV